MSRPLISVILPIYNAGSFLRAAIESILYQTFSDFEVIAINDGSKDDSLQTLQSFTDPRFKVYTQDNQGLVATLNRGIVLSQAPIIARMDQDDISLPSRFEQQYNYLCSNPDIGLLGTTYGIVDAQGKLQYIEPVLLDNSNLRLALLHTHAFAHGSVMFRRSVLYALQTPQYRGDVGRVEDVDLWTRMAQQTRVANLPEVLYLWRRVPTSISHSGFIQQRTEVARVHRSYSESFPWLEEAKYLTLKSLRKYENKNVVVQGKLTTIKRKQALAYHLVQLSKLGLRSDKFLSVKLMWYAFLIKPRFFLHGLWLRLYTPPQHS